jgi:hypothetical protein
LAWRDRSLQLQRAAILGAVIDPKKVARETLSRASRRKLAASANRLSSSYGKQAIEVTRRCRQLWKRRENSGRRRRTPGSHCTACTLRPSVELTASPRQWPVWRLSTPRQIEWGSSCRHLFGWGLSALRHPTAENFRKGGVHEVGTVVFTASAQFGVPVLPCMWALTRGITSYAREIVVSLAEVERRPAAFLAQLAIVAQSQWSSARDKGSALGH